MPEIEANGLRFHVQHLTSDRPAAGDGEAGSGARPQVVMLHGLVIDNLSSWYYTLANPLALLMSAEMMLHHLHEDATAARIRTAYDAVLADGQTRTKDLGGSATTDQFTDAIIAKLK